ncbi:PA2169 family four-helix-bundle protein [Niabella beijingensis]|uniref:PA2169 family four-helix-bundle protein n=1 Tax=Niabella beijingensis TaxID=2872700 RepID=UPI001CBB580F|nr:PA2169 family four-helix-bundle protein [Niabella beijingensis]MBZ4190925.1 PA2169 family four-helix-bundle protein [Niabella beijingensis]
MTTTIDGEVLNDLLHINKDRIAGYERAIAELKEGTEDADLIRLFQNYIDNSNIFVAELADALKKMEAPVTERTTGMGKIYVAWMEIKAFFTGNDRQTILNSCEAVEDAVKKAYESALNQPGLFPDNFSLIKDQNSKLLTAHHQIKRLRDA